MIDIKTLDSEAEVPVIGPLEAAPYTLASIAMQLSLYAEYLRYNKDPDPEKRAIADNYILATAGMSPIGEA